MIRPPANPAEAQARASIMTYNSAIDAMNRAERKRPLYPLERKGALQKTECNDCGIDVWIDDPASCFSGLIISATAPAAQAAER